MQRYFEFFKSHKGFSLKGKTGKQVWYSLFKKARGIREVQRRDPLAETVPRLPGNRGAPGGGAWNVCLFPEQPQPQQCRWKVAMAEDPEPECK